MKKIIYGLLILLAFSSCNDFLDKTPDSRLEVDTPEKVGMLLTSAYPLNAPLALLEFMSDNYTDNGVTWNYAYEIQAEAYLYMDQSTITSDTPHRIWEQCFKAISTANAAFGAAKELEKKGYDMSAYMAEARICRAWNYFLLANTFCHAYNPQSSSTDLGLPYVEERVSNVFAKAERGTVKELWDNINDDIEAALPHLNDIIYKVPKNHFNRKAAYCFAAEFNLYYGNYDKAIEYADIVLGSDPVSKMRNMRDIYATSEAVKEREKYTAYSADCNLMIMAMNSLWGRLHTSPNHNRYGHSRAICYGGSYRSPGPWSGKSGNRYSSSPLALYSSYGSDQYRFYPKMIEIYDYTDASAHAIWVPFTTEKALLTRAEAYILQGKYLEAADDLALWYTSRNGTDTYLTPDELVAFYKGANIIDNDEEIYIGAVPGMSKFDLNPRFELADDGMMEYMVMAILHVRRIELLFEGWRMIDLKRYGISITHPVARSNDIVIEPWDERVALQLPFMILAAGMEANPR